MTYLLLLRVTFTEQKFLIFMKSILSILFLIDCDIGVVYGRSLQNPSSPRFSPALSFRNFVLLYFKFSAMIQLELIFVNGVRIHLYSFACGYPIFHIQGFVKSVFFPLNNLRNLAEDHLTINVHLGFLFCSIRLCVFYISVMLF